jgi:hypothetical protein
MVVLTAAIQMLGLALSLSATQPQLKQDFSSVVLIDVQDNNPSGAGAEASTPASTTSGSRDDRRVVEEATGFIVGWQSPELYIVTVAHAFRDEPRGTTYTTATVTLQAGACGGAPLTATFAAPPDVDNDFVMLKARILSTECREAISRLAPLRRSRLDSVTGVGKRLILIGRTGKDLASREVDVSAWDAEKISLSGRNQDGMSGGLLMTPDGEIVGMASRTVSTSAYAVPFVNIMSKPDLKGIPFDLAGRTSGLELKGYPAGTHLTLNGDPANAIELAPSAQWLPLPPGQAPVPLKLTAHGYDPVEDAVTITDGDPVPRCVALVRPVDRWAARSKWPLLAAGAALGITTAVLAQVTDSAKSSFYAVPTRSAYDEANGDVTLTRAFLIGAVVTGALSVGAFAFDGFRLSPTRRSSIYPCQ